MRAALSRLSGARPSAIAARFRRVPAADEARTRDAHEDRRFGLRRLPPRVSIRIVGPCGRARLLAGIAPHPYPVKPIFHTFVTVFNSSGSNHEQEFQPVTSWP